MLLKGYKVYVASFSGFKRNMTVILIYMCLYESQKDSRWSDVGSAAAYLKQSYKLSYPNVKAATKALAVAKSNRYNIGVYNKINNQKQIRDRSLNREADQETSSPVIVEEVKPEINFVPREGHSLDLQILLEL